MSELEANHGYYLVLKPDRNWDVVRDYLREQGMEEVRTVENPGAINQIEEIWANELQTDSVHIVDDPISGTDYLRILGEQAESYAYEMAVSLPVFLPAALFEDLRNAGSRNEVVDILFRIAVSFPEYHEEAEHAFDYFSQDEHPMMRRAAMQAMAYRTIPEYFPMLERARDNDPDAENRAFAAELLEAMEGGGRP